MTALVGRQAVAHRLLRGVLHLQIQSGVDAQAGFVDFSAPYFFSRYCANLLDEVRSDVVGLGLQLEDQRRALGALGFGRGDLAVLQHVVDHQVAAAQRALRIVDRRIVIRRLGQAGEDGSFFQRQIFGLLAEVVIRAGLEAIDSVAQIDLVGVQSEDLRLW